MRSLALVLIFCLLPTQGWSFQENQLSDLQLRSKVIHALRDGIDYLKGKQKADGSWELEFGPVNEYKVGMVSLAVLALINCDESIDSDTVQRGLSYLRQLPPNKPDGVYEASLVVMALCAAKEIDKDRARIRRLVTVLERTQATKGDNSGLWGYKLATHGGRPGANGEDHSNGQYAVLALRDAAYAGIEVDRDVWQRTHEHWIKSQQSDGGWTYKNEGSSTGSMTAAGLSTLAVTMRMLDDDSDVDAGGRPDCCLPHPPPLAFQKGRKWMARNFSVYSNPKDGGWHYYYLYGLERAARLGNVRLFGKRDWYREGARYLVEAQNGSGSWPGATYSPPELTTAFALLFLSKGLSRVVVNKLDYVSPANQEKVDGDWNRHPLDIPNLIERIDTLKGWPPRLTSQTVALNHLKGATAVTDLNQAPVLFISGKDAPTLTDEHVQWLREYIDEGGFIFASANCGDGTFDKGFRKLILRLFPDGDASLQRLQADHPVYRSEYPLPNAEAIELHGVDFGCRTSIIYSPEDLGCLWHKWMRHDPRDRNEGLIQRIIRANRIGTNVLAYATGREPPIKLNEDSDKQKKRHDKINRGLTEIAQIRHTGGWDTAPKALQNLLRGLNETVGLGVSPQRRTIPITYDELRRFPLVYMHGRYQFQVAPQERDALRDYLSRGNVLFADSCCGSAHFDASFRDLVDQLFPDQPLTPIPAEHELFSDVEGHDIRQVKLRKLVPGGPNAAMQSRTDTVTPVLEGVEIDGRYAVIYSRYDISCALENQASLACDGYEEQDAMKIATNVVLYSMLMDISWSKKLQNSRFTPNQP